MTMQDPSGKPQDSPEPQEKSTPQEKTARPSLTKNILFLAFILLSIFFCAQRFRIRLQRMDYNVGIALYNQGIELLEAKDPDQQGSASQSFWEAQKAFQDAEQSRMDPEITWKAKEMQAQCLAMRAQCPDTLAREAINLYRKAMILDLDCGEVRGLLRIRLEPMSPAERKARLQDMQPAEASPEAPATPAEAPAPSPQ
ncbi:MAG: hypothetical protein ACI4SG_06270 [Oligosphaeraceae bacterium]